MFMITYVLSHHDLIIYNKAYKQVRTLYTITKGVDEYTKQNYNVKA